MKAALVVCPGGEAELRRWLPERTLRAPELVPQGYDPRVGLLAVLGQDPLATWTGPAALGVAAAGSVLAEDESAYLLTPVRAVDGRVSEALEIGPGTARDLVTYLREALSGEVVQVWAGSPPVLVVAESLVGPPTLSPVPLVGRSLEDLPAGPPAVLGRVIEATREACRALGLSLTHLFPNSPSAPSRVKPLRETWLGLGPSAVLGEGTWPRALEIMLSLTRIPTRDPVTELAQVRDRYDLGVLILDAPPASLDLGLPTVVVGEADPLGRVPLAIVGSDAESLEELVRA